MKAEAILADHWLTLLFLCRHPVLLLHLLRYIGQHPHHHTSASTWPLHVPPYETYLTVWFGQIDFVGVGSRFGLPNRSP